MKTPILALAVVLAPALLFAADTRNETIERMSDMQLFFSRHHERAG
jgi:hypothetical protein